MCVAYTPKVKFHFKFSIVLWNDDSELNFFHGLEIFTLRQKYNVPVQMSRHPDVNLYINHIVAACKDGIQKVRFCI
jgi:hypothetical protein